MKKKYNKTLSRSTIYKILKRNNITRKKAQTKKINKKYQEKYDLQLKKIRKDIKKRKKRIISIDETSIDFITPSNYGWSKKGKKCTKKISNKRYRVSLLMAISRNKVVKYYIKEGSINKEDFNNFINDIEKDYTYYNYFMDNARIHHNKILKEQLNKKIIYNVPYCPEYNPIEYVFNTLKSEGKKENIKNIEDLKSLLDRKFMRLRYDNYFEKSYKNLKI